MNLISLLIPNLQSLFIATMIVVPTGFTDGQYLPHACNGFASAAKHVTAEVKNRHYSLSEFLSILNSSSMSKFKREQIEEAIQWVYANQIDNPLIAESTAMAMCLGKKKKSDEPANKARWDGPY